MPASAFAAALTSLPPCLVNKPKRSYCCSCFWCFFVLFLHSLTVFFLLFFFAIDAERFHLPGFRAGQGRDLFAFFRIENCKCGRFKNWRQVERNSQSTKQIETKKNWKIEFKKGKQTFVVVIGFGLILLLLLLLCCGWCCCCWCCCHFWAVLFDYLVVSGSV